MPRPRLRRWVAGMPRATYFKPRGIALRDLDEVRLSVEGLEALRLADLEGLTAEAAAAGMGVSRHTFGRVLAEARASVARALVCGAALRIAGGHYEVADGGGAPAGGELPESAGKTPGAGETQSQEDDAMRQAYAMQGGRGGQGRCGQGRGMGQGQGRGQGQGGRGAGPCGQGRGRGQAGRPAGLAGDPGAPREPVATCVCPRCGQTVPCGPGIACDAVRCPACGAAMAGQ